MKLLLTLSLHGSLVFLIVWSLDRLIGHRMRTSGRRWWWLVIPAAFLVSIPLPILPASGAFGIQSGSAWAPIVDAPTVATDTADSNDPNRSSSWLWIWSAGVLIYLLVVGTRTKLALSGWGRQRLSTDPKLLGLLEDCKQEARITSPIGLIVSDRLSAPAILGWLRPRILLPEEVAAMPAHQIRTILFHELAHFRSLDIPSNWFFTLACALHWFNPLAHLSFRSWTQFREEAADEMAINWMKAPPLLYGASLLSIIGKSSGRSMPFGALTIGEPLHNLKRRIIMINQYECKSHRYIPASLIFILIVAGFVLHPVHAFGTINSPIIPINGTIKQVLQAMQDNADDTTSRSTGLQVVQGFCGADGSWRDVTQLLQKSIRNDALRISWQQPYREIGGDPAWLKVKTLLITYRMKGKTRIVAFQEENFPVGLQATLP